VLAAATNEVRLGRSVSLAADVETWTTADNPEPASHEMIGPPDGHAAAHGLDFAMDRLTMNIHGNADSHLDALCHVIYDGELYNGVPADTITRDGATALSVDVAHDGIVGRGVLLDIPRLRGVPWLEPGDKVTADEVLAAEGDEHLSIGQGDILLLRVGHRRRRAELGPWNAAEARAGLDPAALELLADRGVAVLGSDGNNDTAPSAAASVAFPVHVLAIQALGLYLLDYLQLEDLMRVCEDRSRWTFLCVIAPLRLPTGTGSPVNPIAII
jgi:kynurenine formamidase